MASKILYYLPKKIKYDIITEKEQKFIDYKEQDNAKNGI